MKEINERATQAATDDAVLENLINNSQSFILKCASISAHRYITKNDDEWSIALMSFNKAIQLYDREKGNFLSFANLIIQRGIIDYYRSQSKYSAEISVSPAAFDSDFDEEEENLPIHMAVAEKISEKKDHSLEEEIIMANEMLSQFGISFYDLTDCSPKAKKTKAACAEAIKFLVDNPILMEEMELSKQLPLKIIEKNTKLPRKILERHRKYIIAVAKILAGEYPGLAQYMRFVREES